METLFNHTATKTLELIAKVKRRPRFLYKYCAFADYRSAAIVENRIWVISPSKLNDPFDVQPEIRPLKRREIDTKILHAIAEMDASHFVQTADGYDFVDGKVKDFPATPWLIFRSVTNAVLQFTPENLERAIAKMFGHCSDFIAEFGPDDRGQ